MQEMPMMRLRAPIFIVLMTAMMNGSVAYAGFQFMPPPQKIASAPQRSVINVPQSIAPPVQNNVAGYPAPSVMVEPLNQLAPTPRTQSAKAGRLYIDPYPLRNQSHTQMMPSGQSVMQGMIEKSGRLNPVQLGSGMTTGAKPKNVVAYSASQELPVPRAPNFNGVNALTPIPGGEPAPLPSIEAAYRNKNITAQNIPTYYAHAVGFGRDLPLELAVSQVIPKGFSYDLGGLRKDATLSWEGGEPWNIVLNNMLRTQNMTAIIRGDQVIIQPSAQL
jgi:hypothetical protein